MSIAIVVHGGAGAITEDRVEVAQQGCREAVLIGWHLLRHGGSAMDAVEAAVRVLEDNPNFNAGTGSCLNADGYVETDAGIMEGHTLQVGAVAGVERIKNPITLARKILMSQHVLLVGQGAQEFALENDMQLCKHQELITERQYNNWLKLREERLIRLDGEEPLYHRIEIGKVGEQGEEKHGTVGAVAIDTQGRLAAATSTGGIPNKYPGRVGDSPLIGCGFYADERAAISCTGHGEDFTRLMIAKRAADFAAQGMTARDAASSAIGVLSEKASGLGGLIMVDRLGNVGFAWNSSHMSYAYILDNGMPEPIVGV